MDTFRYQQKEEKGQSHSLILLMRSGWSLSCAHSLAFPNVSCGQINVKVNVKSVNDCPKILKKHFSDEDPKKLLMRHILIFFLALVLYLFSMLKLLKLPSLASWNVPL
jgi:hypothetical protein